MKRRKVANTGFPTERTLLPVCYYILYRIRMRCRHSSRTIEPGKNSQLLNDKINSDAVQNTGTDESVKRLGSLRHLLENTMRWDKKVNESVTIKSHVLS